MLHSLCVVLCVLAFTAQAAAQLYADWLWGFGGQTLIDDEFEECQSVPLVIIPPARNVSALGVPPYYLLVSEVGGIPTTTMIGDDPSNLTWAANHKQGTKLMLTMMDSAQRVGGTSSTLYAMTAGSTSSCLPSLPQDAASVRSNFTDTLQTCDSWDLTIQGGEKPYTIVISGLGLPTIQNETLGSDIDTFTFINRIKPDSQIMASVVDAKGRWGTSTQLIRTAGSSETDCIASGGAASGKAKSAHTQLIIGLVVGLCVPLAAISAAIVWFFRRRARARQEQGIWDRPDLISAAWESPDDSSEPIMRETTVNGGILQSKEVKSPNRTTMQFTPGSVTYLATELGHTGSSSGSNNNTGSTSYTSPYGSASGRSAADLTASYSDMREARTTETYLLPPSAMSHSRVDSDGENDVVIQHRDAGVVRELPPPYADRMGEASPAPPPEKMLSGAGQLDSDSVEPSGLAASSDHGESSRIP